MKKLTILAIGGAGYVLGARAGRGRYEQIASTARSVARNPRVRSAAGKAQDTVAHQAPVVADAVKDKATSAASTVSDKLHRNGGTETAPTTTPAGTTAPPLS